MSRGRPISEATRERLIKYYEDQLRYAKKRPRKPDTPEAFSRRMKIWNHNSLLGHAAMTLKNMQRIIDADTTSANAKMIARAIQSDAYALADALKERIDK